MPLGGTSLPSRITRTPLQRQRLPNRRLRVAIWPTVGTPSSSFSRKRLFPPVLHLLASGRDQLARPLGPFSPHHRPVQFLLTFDFYIPSAPHAHCANLKKAHFLVRVNHDPAFLARILACCLSQQHERRNHSAVPPRLRRAQDVSSALHPLQPAWSCHNC